MSKKVLGNVLLSVTVTVLFTACSEPRNSTEHLRTQTDQKPGLTIVGLDSTEGMVLFDPGREVAEQIIRDSMPGSRIIVRFISDRSYASNQVITDVSIPAVSADEPVNQYDLRGRRKYADAIEKNRRLTAAAKLNAIEAIRSVGCLGERPRTDLVGLFQAAQDTFSVLSSAAQKEIIVISDMVDNRAYKVAPNLSDVKVRIHFLSTDANPEVAQRLKEHWRDRLLSWGAAEVVYRYAEYSGSAEVESSCSL